MLIHPEPDEDVRYLNESVRHLLSVQGQEALFEAIQDLEQDELQLVTWILAAHLNPSIDLGAIVTITHNLN